MKNFKSFLMVLIIIELFVFASCKNNYTPEQAKVACNAEKTTIKGVAKIEDKFVPKGTIINLYRCKSFSFYYLESITISDDEGHFESKNQYDVDTREIFDSFTLKIDEDKPITFYTRVSALLAKEEKVYNFEGEAIIEGFARLDSYFFPSVPDTNEEIRIISEKDNSNRIKLKDEDYDLIEVMKTSDSNGHFKSKRKYNKQERIKYIMRMSWENKIFAFCYDAHISPNLSDVPQYYLFK